MSSRDFFRTQVRLLYFFGQNWISLTGVVLTTSSALALLIFWFYELVLAGTVNPYIGILAFLILPVIFAVGLILIPVGIVVHRHRLRALNQIPSVYPQINLGSAGVQHALLWVGGLTFVNMIIMGTASYSGVSYMDSPKFCGQTCHTVMQPEFTAYQNSPHSRVACVDCHIGPGAGWFVRSKLSGVRQVFAVTFHTYSRPIPSPVKYLRPARETCEQCHWPQRFSGDRFLVLTKYQDDEKNTKLTSVVVMKIGGRNGETNVGIHGHHVSEGENVQYISIDPQRQVIPVVYYTDPSGKTTKYVSTDIKVTQQQLASGEHRTMDCVDCHNRPTHVFETPEEGVNKRLAEGLISADLPFIRKKAVDVLKANYPDRDTAQREIVNSISEYYRTAYPAIYQSRRSVIQQSAEQVAAVYLRNVFPAMNVTWGTYPNNLGHMDYPGCFRCHDGSHTSADGQTITNDCSACHTLLAVDEQNPKVLTDLGVQ
ncbi:MAG TPA: NapC/NirT family cytochrome c [Candidatus Acidoferrum sp.]|nr:NapC/NirT family cytochrome c [Candidatus Acidoferrum sp.]